MDSFVKVGKSQTELLVSDKLSVGQAQAVKELQGIAFSEVEEQEIAEDFYSPRDAHILAYLGGELVGYASVHHALVDFEGQQIKLGGFGGVCTRSDMVGRGIGTQVVKSAMEYLKKRGDDIAFLSVDTTKPNHRLYEKIGFVMLPRNFSWTNSKGQLKADGGGMIAPVNSQELFSSVLRGSDTFYVGNGYW